MPRQTKDGMIPYEPINQKDYHKEYYKKNRDLIRAKRMMAKEIILTEDVKAWKEQKMKDPWALYPFYDPSSNKRYGEEENKSQLDISSSSVSIASKALL